MTNRTFGIEIEGLLPISQTHHGLAQALTAAGIPCYAESYNHTTRGHWKVVSDGSVRGPGAISFELVSPVLSGEAGLAQIRTVCGVLACLGASVNRTCRPHVHHGATDFKARHFDNLFALYAKAEQALDTIVAPSRRGNTNPYCRSLTGQTTQVLQHDRFHKLNLCSFYRHGTVEIRHHQGTVEAEKIIAWVLLTQGLVERAKKAVNTESTHSLTLYDVLQAARALNLRDYFYARRDGFAAHAAA